MRTPLFKYLSIVPGVVAVFVAGPDAQAEDPSPTEPADELFLDPAIVGDEVIEIWDERPDKPFDRDTVLRLTGEELLEQGATDLADAIDLLPDIYVREAGRGGRQIDIRGARKGSVKVLVDGVAVDDPFYGNFDLSSIPVTDIVQIRVSSSPASPIDGVGGPGGVIEVHTRDAAGARHVAARLRGSSLPSADASVTGRAMITKTMAVRISSSGTVRMRDFAVAMPGGGTKNVDESRRSANGAIRVEYRNAERRRIVLDTWVQQRSYVVPPGEDGVMGIRVIDGEASARFGLRADEQIGKLRLQGRVYAHMLTRDSLSYADASLADQTSAEKLAADRTGAGVLANRPLGKDIQLITSANFDSEAADVSDGSGAMTGGRAGTSAVATGIQWERGIYKLDASVGVAAPVGIDANPWPEIKLAAAYRPASPIEIKITGARKGRIPTLRERFRTDIGNEDLGPEHAWFGEVGVTLKPAKAVSLKVDSYLRRTNGLVRFDSALSSLINTGELSIRGVDTRIDIAATNWFGGGASWSFTDAYSPTLGTDPLDFLPQNRGEVWVSVNRRARMGGRLRLSYVGSRIDRNTELPSYTSAGLSGFVRIGHTMTGSVKVGNVLDESYDLRSGGVRAPGRVLTLLLQGQWD